MSFCRHGFGVESDDSTNRRCDLLEEFIQFMQKDDEVIQSRVSLKPGRPFVGDNHAERWTLHCASLARFVLLAPRHNKANTADLFDANMVKLCWSLATNCLLNGQSSSAYCVSELGILVQACINCPSSVNFAHLLVEHYHPPGTLMRMLHEHEKARNASKEVGEAQNGAGNNRTNENNNSSEGNDDTNRSGDNNNNDATQQPSANIHATVAAAENASYDIIRHFQKPLQNLGRNVEIFIAGKIPCSCLEACRTNVRASKPIAVAAAVQPIHKTGKTSASGVNDAAALTNGDTKTNENGNDDGNHGDSVPDYSEDANAIVQPGTIPMGLKLQSQKWNGKSSPARKLNLKRNSSTASNSASAVRDASQRSRSLSKRILQERSSTTAPDSPQQAANDEQPQSNEKKPTAPAKETKQPGSPRQTTYKYKARSFEIKRRAIAAKRATMLGTAAIVSSPEAGFKMPLQPAASTKLAPPFAESNKPAQTARHSTGSANIEALRINGRLAGTKAQIRSRNSAMAAPASSNQNENHTSLPTNTVSMSSSISSISMNSVTPPQSPTSSVASMTPSQTASPPKLPQESNLHDSALRRSLMRSSRNGSGRSNAVLSPGLQRRASVRSTRVGFDGQVYRQDD